MSMGTSMGVSFYSGLFCTYPEKLSCIFFTRLSIPVSKRHIFLLIKNREWFLESFN